MKIECGSCGYEQETSKDLWVQIIGGAMPAGGFYAWVTYLFAGTGFAYAICAAMVAGGPALYVYKDEIVEWMSNQGYECPKCNQTNWKA